MPPPIGIIAGAGRLPELQAAGIRAAGREAVCVGLSGSVEADRLRPIVDDYAEAGLLRLGRWAKLLNRWGATEAVMVGKVRKTILFEHPLSWVRLLPDRHVIRMYLGTHRKDRRDQLLLAGVADTLQQIGVTLIDTTRYIPEHLASPGPMTTRKPDAARQADIDFGWPILMRLVELDIGQAVAIREGDVVAVEAMEGTDGMIRRAGEITRGRPWTLIKGCDAGKDLRFDVPTIGPQTIELAASCRCKCIAVAAGRVIMVDKPALIAAADRAGISLVGVLD